MSLKAINEIGERACKGHILVKHEPGDTVFESVPPLDFKVRVLDEDAKICKLLDKLGKAAIALGEVVIFRQNCLTPKRLRHEAIHVQQWRNDGWWFGIKYLAQPSKYEKRAEEAETV